MGCINSGYLDTTVTPYNDYYRTSKHLDHAQLSVNAAFPNRRHFAKQWAHHTLMPRTVVTGCTNANDQRSCHSLFIVSADEIYDLTQVVSVVKPAHQR